MRDQRIVPLIVAFQGVLAGMAGAAALSVLVAAGRIFLGGRSAPATVGDDAGITAGQALAEGPDLPPDMNRVTATFVQKVATGIFGSSLTLNQQRVAGTLWHFMYGGFWGMLYALLQSSVPIPQRVLGPVYGLAVWAVGFAWLVPQMKLILPPSQQRLRTTAIAMGVHAAYGTIVALAFHLFRNQD